MPIAANIPRLRTANDNSLGRIVDTRSLGRLRRVAGLGAREYRWLCFLAVLVRLGYERIEACQGALTDCEERTSGEAGSSRATTYRALADLEEHGWITRARRSSGRRLIINFSAKLIDFVNGKAVRAVPKKSDNILPVSSCDTLDRTINPSPSPSPSALISPVQSDARARGDCMVKTKPRKRFPPVVYSLRCVAPPRLRELLTRIAVAEMVAGDVGRSGVDWEHWAATWAEIGIAAREHFAREEILPALRAVICPPTPEPSPGDVDELPGEVAGSKAVEEEPPEDLELALLWWARRNARSSLGGLGGT